MVSEKLLVKYGFISDKATHDLFLKKTEGKPLTKATAKNKEEWEKYVNELDEKKLHSLADQEFSEDAKFNYSYTGYPNPNNSYWLIYQRYNLSIEESYYWIHDWMRHNLGYANIDKITDIFSASEQSSMFGNSQQRLGMQQDKVTQFLAAIGKMIKDLFQIVREMRILDERLAMYAAADPTDKRNKMGTVQESAEISLKGIWIDLVEQGSKNPASVYGMARELQFTTLPDLFFKYSPQTNEEIEKMINPLEFNLKVKEVLKRKLRTFIEWKHFTHEEMRNKRIFTLKYLRQHYDVIDMYMNWIRPYLRNIKRLHQKDHTDSSELINAFEGAITEMEILGYKLPETLKYAKPMKKNKKVYSVILAYFFYRTRAMMNFQQEYQKGPVHVGKVEMKLKTFAWTKSEIENYKDMKKEEDLDMIAEVDSSIREAMNAMGGELKKYLEETERRIYGDKKVTPIHSERPKQGFFEPFRELFNLGDTFSFKSGAVGDVPNYKPGDEESTAKSKADSELYNLYKEYKVAHKMLFW